MPLSPDVVAALTAVHTGDADAVEDVFHDEVEFVPNAGEPSVVGRDATLSWFLAYGGRRETFEVLEQHDAAGATLVRWVLHLQADSAAYAHHGWAKVELADGLIARWDAIWTEVETDRSHWDD